MMRLIYILCLLTLVASALFAQVPQAFKYQAVARDLNGDPLINHEISVKISIFSGSPEGTLVYSELHQITTNGMGLFTLEIGNPTQVLSGNFAEISWGTSSHFLQTAIDLTGSGQFEVLGVIQFLSVPYALYAGQTGDTTNWQKNQNVVYYNKGQVGIGTSQPDSSAKLDVNSNSQGFLPPRMTTEERDSIPNPAAGLIIFNTYTHCINFFNGSEWVEYGRDPMDTFECGQMFTDPRDKQQYQTVQIGEQCWFAENLNVGTKINASLNQTDNGVVEKYCYENVPANCSEYGGLYQWDELMAYDTLENTRGICPEGWHLPNQAEWQTLFDDFGGANAAGTELATTGTSGFDALMNGKFDAVAGFSGQNNLSTFWSSSGTLGVQATGYDFTSGNPVVNTSNGSVFNGFGVRCLKGLPNVTDPNIKVIDTLVYRLLSDSLEMVQGIYRYEIIGSRKAKDIITNENIVVGTEADGYLRKVDEATIAGNEMTLTTSDATFENAFIEGEFNLNTGLTGKGKPVFTFTRVKYLATGVEISPQKDGFTYNFTNVVLYEDDNISVTVPQGHVTLDPEFNFDFKFKNRQVKRLLFAAENTVFENSLDVQLDVTGSINAEYDTTLAHIEKYIVFWAGPVPVVVVIKTKLIGKVGCSFDAEFMATTGYTNTNNISFGVKYEYGDWQKIWDLDSDTELHPINWNETISLNQYLKIIPQIDIMFYGVAGPYFKLPLWEELEANIIAPSFDSDASLDIGLDGNLGAKVTIFGETLADYNKDIFGFEYNLYKTPAKLEMVSGNNQSGNINTQLPMPLKVKVTDSQDWTYIPARVHFSVESGGGSLTETDLWTDSDGFAQTYWTLGSLEGDQTVKVEVQKANGSPINGSPQIFVATAQQTYGQCGLPFTDARDSKTYNTVQIGDQCWMKENLAWLPNVYPYSNGSTTDNYYYVYNYQGNSVPEAKATSNYQTYGVLYNWPASLTACPEGWRLPTDVEWTILTSYVSSKPEFLCNTNSSYIAKSLASTTNWNASTATCAVGNNPATNNATGFYGLPGGYRLNTGYHNNLVIGYWWSSSLASAPSAWSRKLAYLNAIVFRDDNSGEYGFSVRCIKNETTSYQLNVTPQTRNVPAIAGTTTFDISSNTSWTIMIDPSAPWLSVVSPNGNGNATLNVVYEENTDSDPRTGQITILAQGGSPTVSVTVIQAGSCGQPFTDPRDGQVYNTVQIGNQCWLKENMNYAGGGVCYNNDAAYCAIYGRLYVYQTALGICPTGWHLPSFNEFSTMYSYLRDQSQYFCENNDMYTGKAIAAKTNWNSSSTPCSIGNDMSSNNLTGLSLLPGGTNEWLIGFRFVGEMGTWWTSTPQYEPQSVVFMAYHDSFYFYGNDRYQGDGYSVRCVKD